MLDKKVTHIFSTQENTLSLIMDYCNNQCNEDTGNYLQITTETVDDANSLVFINYRGQVVDMVSNLVVVIERGKTYSDEDKTDKRSQILKKLSKLLGIPEGPVEHTYVKYLDFLVSGECTVSTFHSGLVVGTKRFTTLIIPNSFNELILEKVRALNKTKD